MTQLEPLIWLIPLPPLLAFFVIWFLTNRHRALSHTVAIGFMAVSWILSLVVLISALAQKELGRAVFADSVPWLPLGDSALRMGVLVDPLTAAMLFFVPLTCLLIFLYSVGYQNFGQRQDPHDEAGSPPHGGVEPMYSRFFAFLSLFAFGMLALVVADNLLLLFIGWEIMGLCSYLLIGFWHGRNYKDPKRITPRQAAVKAFITTRIGDVIMLLGIVSLYFSTTTEKAREILGTAGGTLAFRDILYNPEFLEYLAREPSLILGLSLSGLIGLLLFAGTVGKSAQFPLHVWLPDAMEGPTPVSAMIHAATMVSAGVYAAIRLFPLMSAGWQHGGSLTAPMMAMGLVGGFTALFAATIALAQRDIKKVLAYSTISQLGYMIAALGIGAYVAAAFHLVTHAFFKALLFLGSGSVIHGVEHGQHHAHEDLDPQDMFNMGGLRTKMPVTFWTFLAGGLALAGFPFITAGFWSKDEIFADAFGGGHWVVFAVLVTAALLTAFYTMRLIALAFLGRPRTESAAHAHETPWTMTVPLIVLSVFAILAGYLGVPKDFPGFGPLLAGLGLSRFELVGATLAEELVKPEFNLWPLAASLVVSLGGLFLGWWVYGRRPLAAGQPDPLRRALGPVYGWLEKKYGFDELYQKIFVRPAIWISEILVYEFMDRKVIDGFLHGVARLAMAMAGLLTQVDKATVNDTLSNRTGSGVRRLGGALRVIQTGQVQTYLLMAILALLAMGGVYYWVLR